MTANIFPLEAEVLQGQRVERKRIPWEDNPRGVVSLLDMLKLYAKLFTEALCEMYRMEARWEPTDTIVPQPSSVAAHLVGLQIECASYGLTETEKKCVRIMNDCHTRPITYRETVAALKELRERFQDELESELFLHLDTKQAQLYEKPKRGWEEVTVRFPKVRHDIEESSKCFALERYGAAVFHVMLIAEYGVIQVADVFGVAGDRPGWASLDRLQRIHDKNWNDKTPLEQKHSKLLENLLPLAFAMKESWRHKMDHVANKIEWMDTIFSPEVADDIISATRGFMRRLALDLPKFG
jgi:hypothetical protein